jgi:uncharacterized protein
MKKTIIMLGVVLVGLSSATFANNVNQVQTGFSKEFSSAENQYEKFDHSPICKAIIKGDVDAVKKFIEYGVNVNEVSNGLTPLMLAARYNNVEIINVLLAKGANKKAKDEKGFDALKYAQMSKATDALEVLMRA